MSKSPINPWTWQEPFGFTHAWKIDAPATWLVVSGQGPIDAHGHVLAADDFEAQARQTFTNLGTVLHAAGTDFNAIVKLTVYLTDITNLRTYGQVRAEHMPDHQPASTAIGVTALALPGMQLEIEALCVQTS